MAKQNFNEGSKHSGTQIDPEEQRRAAEIAANILDDKKNNPDAPEERNEGDPDPTEIEVRTIHSRVRPEQASSDKKTRLPQFDETFYRIIPHYLDENKREVSAEEDHIAVSFNIAKSTVTSLFASKSGKKDIVIINGAIELPRYEKDYASLSLTEKIFVDEAEVTDIWQDVMKKEYARVEAQRSLFTKMSELLKKQLTENLKFE